MKFAIEDLAFECEDALPADVDVDDDIKREAAFAQQALNAAAKARRIAIAAGIAFDRPAGHACEMVKTLEQMGRIAARTAEAESARKAREEARRQRENRKTGKQVQVAREQEKARARAAELKKIEAMRKKTSRVGKVTAAGIDGEDEFDIDVDEDGGLTGRKNARGAGPKRTGKGVSAKRAARNERYGFGGPKRGKKRNDRESADRDDFDPRQNRRPFPGTKNRPGKTRREQMRSKKASKAR